MGKVIFATNFVTYSKSKFIMGEGRATTYLKLHKEVEIDWSTDQKE